MWQPRSSPFCLGRVVSRLGGLGFLGVRVRVRVRVRVGVRVKVRGEDQG